MKGKKKMFNNVNELWGQIIERDIATHEELELITSISGYNVETLNDVIYARTGYHTMDQIIEDEA